MQTSLPKISIVTITWGHEKFIEQTLDGVFSQNYEGPIEFIISNDKSPDKTDEIINNYLLVNKIPPNFEIKYTNHEKNMGSMNNFIWSLQQVTGKYIAICEGDDYWTDPHKLQKQVDFLEANEIYGACITDACIIDSINNSKRNYNEPYRLIQGIIPEEKIFEFGGGIYHTATLVMRAKFLVLLDEIKEDIFGDEKLIFSFCINKIPIYFINQVTAVYNFSGNGVYSQLTNDKSKLIATQQKEIKELKKIKYRLDNEQKKLIHRRIKKHIFSILEISNFKLNYIFYIKDIGLRTFFKKIKWKL